MDIRLNASIAQLSFLDSRGSSADDAGTFVNEIHELYTPESWNVMHSFDVFFSIGLNKEFNKEPICRGIETPLR